MANTNEIQVLEQGPRNLVLKHHLDSDGASGEITLGTIVDVSAYNCAEVILMEIWGTCVGFTIEYIWDATADLHAIVVPDYDFHQCYKEFGGIKNNTGAGKTGDVLFTTTGFTAAGDTGHIISMWRKLDALT